jgi:hypothetical protein
LVDEPPLSFMIYFSISSHEVLVREVTQLE